MSLQTQSIPVEIVLWGIQSPINTGMVMRITELYQLRLGIFDPFGILNHVEKLQTISDFSCGAYTRQGFRNLSGLSDLHPETNSQRVIATSIDDGSISLEDFIFQPGDSIIFGNEYDGVSEELINSADCCLHIPTPKIFLPKYKSFSPIDHHRDHAVAHNGVPSHNVAVSVGIISHAIYLQSLKTSGFNKKQSPD